MSAHVLAFSVDGMPQTKGSWRARSRGAGRGVRLVPDNPRERSWADLVAWAARMAKRGLRPDARRYRVTLEFILSPPPSRRRTNRRDLDKLIRSVLDALTGIVWLDDEQVDHLIVTKRIGDDPGLLVNILV